MNHLVFDAESVGLHGEAFAVAAVVIDADSGEEIASMYAACDSAKAQATPGDEIAARAWLAVNCLPHLPPPNRSTPGEIRDTFWHFMQLHARRGQGVVWADCGWPVEARFLIACAEDDMVNREWTGPYPLYEITTLEDMLGLGASRRLPDRQRALDLRRQPNELPEHNPLADARYSARRLWHCLRRMRGLTSPPGDS